MVNPCWGLPRHLKSVFSQSYNAPPVYGHFSGAKGDFDVKQAIEQIQAGKVDYREDKAGIIHASLGKASFTVDDLEENFQALMAALIKAKPSSSKGHYVKGVAVSTTMGVGVRVAYTPN